MPWLLPLALLASRGRVGTPSFETGGMVPWCWCEPRAKLPRGLLEPGGKGTAFGALEPVCDQVRYAVVEIGVVLGCACGRGPGVWSGPAGTDPPGPGAFEAAQPRGSGKPLLHAGRVGKPGARTGRWALAAMGTGHVAGVLACVVGRRGATRHLISRPREELPGNFKGQRVWQGVRPSQSCLRPSPPGLPCPVRAGWGVSGWPCWGTPGLSTVDVSPVSGGSGRLPTGSGECCGCLGAEREGPLGRGQ